MKLFTMSQKIQEPVSVSFSYDSEKQKVFPRWIIWNGKLRPVSKVGLHHTYKDGKTLYHVFSVVSNGMYLRLLLDTQTLHWKLEELSDGVSS